MIAVYRGEDTDFAGAEPIQIKLDTALDLTGYTAKLFFGSIVKNFPEEEVRTKTIGLVLTAVETESVFPGKGYAIIKAYDPQGRESILKKFVIDVRFRHSSEKTIDAIDLAESLNVFQHLRKVVSEIQPLDSDADLDEAKDVINRLLSAIRMRTEFNAIPECEFSAAGRRAAYQFVECTRELQKLSVALPALSSDADIEEVREAINRIILAIGDADNPRSASGGYDVSATPNAALGQVRDALLNLLGSIRK